MHPYTILYLLQYIWHAGGRILFVCDYMEQVRFMCLTMYVSLNCSFVHFNSSRSLPDSNSSNLLKIIPFRSKSRHGIMNISWNPDSDRVIAWHFVTLLYFAHVNTIYNKLISWYYSTNNWVLRSHCFSVYCILHLISFS